MRGRSIPIPMERDPLPRTCDPLKAGRYLCDEIGKRWTSLVGYSLIYDNRNGIRATRGQRVVFSQDFAGLGGDVKYVRTRVDATKYIRLPKELPALAAWRGRLYSSAPVDRRAKVVMRSVLRDRFFGGQMRGFDIRGIGPRISRQSYDTDGNLLPVDKGRQVTDALGGRAYYLGRAEVEIPVSANIRSLGTSPVGFYRHRVGVGRQEAESGRPSPNTELDAMKNLMPRAPRYSLFSMLFMPMLPSNPHNSALWICS